MEQPASADGRRRALLILHGANGSRAEVQPWCAPLSAAFEAHALDLWGHAGRPLPDAFTMPGFAQDLLDRMDALQLHEAVFMGHSFGGTLALYMAAHHPSRVSGVVTVAARWHYGVNGIGHATHILGQDRLAHIPGRAEALARLHAPTDWRRIAGHWRALYASFAQRPPVSADDLLGVRCPGLVVSGTRDPIAGTDETTALHRSLRGSTLALYEGSGHPSTEVPLRGLQRVVCGWAADHGLAPPA